MKLSIRQLKKIIKEMAPAFPVGTLDDRDYFEKKGIDHEKAFKILLEANKEKPNNPDTLNYLGFTSRKLGNFETAEDYYLAGLKIKPNHKRINQYLGELYLNSNRKDKAIEQLTILESCNCKEYEQLKEIIDGKRTSKY